MPPRIPRALTIAGSDSGGGAGIQADLKTFAALGVHGTCAITALTAQNTRGVAAIHAIPAEFVGRQIAAVLDDIGTDAAKTGMLACRETVLAVARLAERYRIGQLVVDPVLLSKHGAALLAEDALDAYITTLLPKALVVTPNASEAARFVGFEVHDRETQRRAAQAIARMGPRFVLVKGGHLPDPQSVTDVLYHDGEWTELTGPRIDTIHTHGTGCTLSAAVAAFLARGDLPIEAIAKAREFVTHAIRHSLDIGGGPGPVNPMWETRRNLQERA